MYVLDPQVDATWTDRLSKAIVGVVELAGEVLLPAMDQTRGDGLGPDVHEPPLPELVISESQIPAVDGHEDILSPGDEEPNDA